MCNSKESAYVIKKYIFKIKIMYFKYKLKLENCKENSTTIPVNNG